jgi:Fic family protein
MATAVKKEDLHPDLQQPYTQTRGYGLQKINDPAYQNIFFVIPKPPPKSMAELTKGLPRTELLSALSKANKVLNDLKPLGEMDEIDRLVAGLILRQEALSSSKIEGTFSTIDEVFAPTPGASYDAMSVASYAKVMEEILATAARKEKILSIGLLKKMHKAIIAGDDSYNGIPGQFRGARLPDARLPGDIVLIGGLRRKEQSIYNPAPPEHVGWLMERFMDWLTDDLIQPYSGSWDALQLPAAMAVGHAHFEAIHPFSDGNGRVGRMLWPIQMIMSEKAPIMLSSFIDAYKEEYYEGLKAYQQKLTVLPFLDYLGDAIQYSKREHDKTKTAIAALPGAWRKKLKAREGSSAVRLLTFLLSSPVMTTGDAAKALAVSIPAAWNALSDLEKAGIVLPKDSVGKGKKFYATDVLAILSRPFGVDPEEYLILQKQMAEWNTLGRNAVQMSTQILKDGYCHGPNGKGCKRNPPTKLQKDRLKLGICSYCMPRK